MKVAMIGWEYPPFKVGGLGTHCYGLTRSLADKNVKVDFYMPKTKRGARNDKKNLDIALLYFDSVWTSFSYGNIQNDIATARYPDKKK